MYPISNASYHSEILNQLHFSIDKNHAIISELIVCGIIHHLSTIINLCILNFLYRLIVVAEKQIVYDKFPIPLINRLEKHFLSLKTMLTPCQLDLTEKLQEWAQNFCEAKVPAYMRKK